MVNSTDVQEPSSREGNTARLFALAFAVLTIICVGIGSYYVRFFWLDQDVSSLIQGPDSGDVSSATLLRVTLTVAFRLVPLLLIAFFALSFARASISFVKSSEYSRTGVVPPRDLPIIAEAIKTGKPEPIDQYIRLASLTGGVGLFQKVGLTGLPLVTLGLVVFFALGVIVSDDTHDTFKAFLDFTKLTLGAFIGSFVQRQVERRGQESDIQRAIQTVAQQTPKQGGDGLSTPPAKDGDGKAPGP